MGALLKEHEEEIQEMTLIPSAGGKFEVSVNGKLIYSKLETGKHTDPGQVLGLFQSYLKEQ